jgi:hypothetical protein
MITGRSAPSSRARTRSRSPLATGSASTSCSAPSTPVSSPSENTWSIGKSKNVGPECGAMATASASSTSPGISSGDPAVAASLVSGATNGTWSIS